uniref:Uncharacterized protein n=1 Tax=Arundo donax TaxID=35708 RepID=A0A0A8YYJ8_ARUDO
MLGPGSRTTGVPANNLFGQFCQPSHQAFPAPTFGSSEVKFGVSGPFGSQTSKQPSGSLQGSSMSSVNNFPKSPVSSSVQHRDIDRQSLDLLNGMMAPTSAINQAPVQDDKMKIRMIASG